MRLVERHDTLLYIVGDWSTGGTRTAVARHHRAASGARLVSVGVNDLLCHLQTFVAPMRNGRSYGNMVMPMYLGVEVDLEMDNHYTEIALIGSDGNTSISKIMRLAKVKEFHDYCIVDMSHHVHIVES